MTKTFDPFGFVGSVSYYDLVLAVIPAVFAVSVLVGTLLAVEPHVAFAVGSALAGLALVDALFVNPPTDPTGNTTGRAGGQH